MCKIFCLWYDRNREGSKKNTRSWSDSNYDFWEIADCDCYDGERSESVEEKLIELGLAPEKIIETKGNGDLNPVASNDTEEGRAANRRIEVQFVN